MKREMEMIELVKDYIESKRLNVVVVGILWCGIYDFSAMELNQNPNLV